MTQTSSAAPATTLALKEWAAVVHALLDGRQTVLLRKGGIGEKGFAMVDDRFVLFPTVAHSHAERVRPEHAELLSAAAGDASGGTLTVRCGVTLAGVVEVARPERLPEIADLHIWTDESVQRDRVDFRPRKPLQVLVVRAHPLPEPVTVPRLDTYAGCSSWVDLPLEWRPGAAVHDDARLQADVERVRAVAG